MLSHDSLTAAQFITVLVAIAVALTGWMTLILTNRRLRAERAIPVIKMIRSLEDNRIEIVVENVGVRVALDLVLSSAAESRTIIGGLRSGERVIVHLPSVEAIDLRYRDAGGSHRQLVSRIVWTGNDPSVAVQIRKGWLVRAFVRTGFLQD